MAKLIPASLIMASMCVAFLLAKLSLNYSGVCTEGLLIWKWHRTESRELLARLQENGSINAGVHAEYKLVEEWQVPGDHYQPSSFMDKIEGNAATLVSYHLPWLDGGGYLITGGYFYAPNCIREWRLPR